MLLTLLDIVLPVFAVAALGFGFGRRRGGEPDMAFINHANVVVFCPALVFSALLGHPVSVLQSWPLAVAGVLIIVVPGALLALVRRPGVGRAAFLVPGMFRNTGNIGIPLMMLAYGKDLLGDIVILFVISNLLHFSLGLMLLSRAGGAHESRVSDGAASIRPTRTQGADATRATATLHDVEERADSGGQGGYAGFFRTIATGRWQWLRNPNVWAAVLGVVLAPWRAHIPGFVITSVDLVGQIAIPLMLFGLGVRLSASRIGHLALALRINGLYLLAGAITLPLVLWLLPLTPEWSRLVALSVMLPPAVLNYMLCEQYAVEPEAVANVVLLGNLLSVATIPLVVWATLTWL